MARKKKAMEPEPFNHIESLKGQVSGMFAALTPGGLYVTNSQVYLLKEPMGKTLALARVVLNDQIQLTGLKIMDGMNGLFVSYPNDPTYKGEEFKSLFYPITAALRDHIMDVLVGKYKEALAMENIGV